MVIKEEKNSDPPRHMPQRRSQADQRQQDAHTSIPSETSRIISVLLFCVGLAVSGEANSDPRMTLAS